MSFEEKSTWAVLVSFVLVYGWYFLEIYGRLSGGDVAEIDYKTLLGTTLVLLIIFSIVTHIAIAVMAPDESDKADERDRDINIRGEYLGGFVVSVAALVGIGLAFMELDHFWIANALLLGLVIAEVITDCTKLYFYRRGC